jgi:hypothetical protein
MELHIASFTLQLHVEHLTGAALGVLNEQSQKFFE